MLACDATKKSHVFDIERCKMPAIRTLACLLACDASARDAKSLANRVERCEPLRTWSLNAHLAFWFLGLSASLLGVCPVCLSEEGSVLCAERD